MTKPTKNWWVNLTCLHCNKPVKVSDQRSTFTYNQGRPLAEHHHCIDQIKAATQDWNASDRWKKN